MATCAEDPRFILPCNWLRVGGISGSMAIHFAALLLLAIPVALPTLRPAAPELSVRWIEAPPPVEAVPLPAEPEPQPLPRPRVTPIPVRVPVPEIAVDSVMAVPAAPALDRLPATPTAAGIAGPANPAGANVRLDYASTTRPRYPIDSMRRGEEGTVLLRVLVGRDGVPVQIDIARSSGYRQLDRAAREAVLGWRFRPVQIDGAAVQASGIVPVAFSLQRG